MEVQTGGRQTGKTHYALSWLAADSDRIMYVHSRQEVDRLLRDHPELQGKIFSFRERVNGRGKHNEVAIDNADLILQILFGDVKLITLEGN